MIARRDFIVLFGGAAAAWPIAAHAQQPSRPVLGFLGPTSHDVFAERLRGFHRGLKEAGYVEGENLTITHRWAEGEFDRLPALATELVRRQVSVIVAGATSAALAAKAATTTIPVLFIVAEDPVGLGLVASVARPGRNVTGVNLLSAEVASKRLEFLRELIPGAARVALLINPADANTSESIMREVDTRCARDRAQHRGPPRQHHRRDRCGLCGFRARAAGRAFPRYRSVLYRPARSIGQLGLAPCDPHGIRYT
jgi:putative ABC transport system substrate-binding protein